MKNIKVIVLITMFIFFVQNTIASTSPDLEAGIEDLAKKITKSMIAKNKQKIAVIEFTDLDNKVNPLGQFISEELITQLFIVNSGGFEVVERRQLAKVLDQQKLSVSGLLDPKAMKNVGKILGVDAIVTGSMTDLGNTTKINSRIIAVDSAKIFAGASTNIPKVGSVITLMKQNKSVNDVFDVSIKSQASKNTNLKNTNMKTISLSNFDFKLKNCKQSGSEIHCNFLVVNKGKNRPLSIRASNRASSAVDINGNQYLAKNVTLGATTYYDFVTVDIIQDVPMKAGVTFVGVDELVSHFSAITLSAMNFGKVVFKNIPVGN